MAIGPSASPPSSSSWLVGSSWAPQRRRCCKRTAPMVVSASGGHGGTPRVGHGHLQGGKCVQSGGVRTRSILLLLLIIIMGMWPLGRSGSGPAVPKPEMERLPSVGRIVPKSDAEDKSQRPLGGPRSSGMRFFPFSGTLRWDFHAKRRQNVPQGDLIMVGTSHVLLASKAGGEPNGWVYLRMGRGAP